MGRGVFISRPILHFLNISSRWAISSFSSCKRPRRDKKIKKFKNSMTAENVKTSAERNRMGEKQKLTKKKVRSFSGPKRWFNTS